MKKYFLVGIVKKEIEINVLGASEEISLEWADGMVGAMPVFSSRKAAEKYKGKNENLQIYEFLASH